jgi:hypothetical protein
MVPDFALRIQSMIRSMQEVVIPAIPSSQRLALDQANIIVGNLRIMAEQHDKLFQYELVELREFVSLVREMAEAAVGGAASQASKEGARPVLENATKIVGLSIPTQSELAALTRSMKSAADALLRAAYEDGEPGFRAVARAAVMRQSESQIMRERSWFRMAGFELEPGKLATLEQVLA